MNVNPTAYTHRQILVGNRILTAKKVLSIIIDEVKGQTDLGNGGAIIDVATALICAPDTASWEQGVSCQNQVFTPQISRIDANQRF